MNASHLRLGGDGEPRRPAEQQAVVDLQRFRALRDRIVFGPDDDGDDDGDDDPTDPTPAAALAPPVWRSDVAA